MWIDRHQQKRETPVYIIKNTHLWPITEGSKDACSSNIIRKIPFFSFSPEEALQEFVTEENKEYLESAIVFLTEFMNSEHSGHEKNEYIQHCADGLYFPALGLTPIQWLKTVVEQLKEAVKTK